MEVLQLFQTNFQVRRTYQDAARRSLEYKDSRVAECLIIIIIYSKKGNLEIGLNNFNILSF